jgi:hypothetical protein
MNEWLHTDPETGANVATEETQLVALEGVVVSIVGAPVAPTEREAPMHPEVPFQLESAPDHAAEPIAPDAPDAPHQVIDLIAFLETSTDAAAFAGVVPQTIILGGNHARPEPAPADIPPATTDHPAGHLGRLAHQYETQIFGEAA